MGKYLPVQPGKMLSTFHAEGFNVVLYLLVFLFQPIPIVLVARSCPGTTKPSEIDA